MSVISEAEALLREDTANRAFLEPEETRIAAITLRPVTLASITLLQETRNEFLFPRGPVGEIYDPANGTATRGPTIENELFAALSFGYLHAAPLPDVRRAAFLPAFFREQVLEWGELLSPESLPDLIAEIKRRLSNIRTLQFATKSKPATAGDSGPQPPPNS